MNIIFRNIYVEIDSVLYPIACKVPLQSILLPVFLLSFNKATYNTLTEIGLSKNTIFSDILICA